MLGSDEAESDDGVPPLAAFFLLQAKEFLFQTVGVGNHFAFCDLSLACTLEAKFANSQTLVRAHGRTKHAACHGTRLVQIAESGFMIENGARFIVRKSREFFVRFRTFVEHTCYRIAGKALKQSRNRILHSFADPPGAGRIRLLQIPQPFLKSRGIKLINAKCANAALRASRTASEPGTALTGCFRQCSVHDLNQIVIACWWPWLWHISQHNAKIRVTCQAAGGFSAVRCAGFLIRGH